MPNLYDIAYSLALALSCPYWLLKPSARLKVRRALSQRMGDVPTREGQQPAALIHAVSLGEVNATRLLVQRLQELRPDLHIIISTTTETGLASAQELYSPPTPPLEAQKPRITVIRYPLDFTSAINRVLDRLRPTVVALMELELWPNFILQCHKRNIPVVLINGRLTEPSFRKYRLLAPLRVIPRMLRRLKVIAAQDQIYANRFIKLGAPGDRVHITGTMKFDTAQVADRVTGDAALASDLDLVPAAIHKLSTRQAEIEGKPQERIWVCGSTGPGEEELILDQYRKLLAKHARLRLVIVPRKPERFDEVARLIESAGFKVIRRSRPTEKPDDGAPSLIPPVILGDTMGELRKFYALADVVFVGRTLVDLGPRQHGSDMIEPAALAKPTIVGPFTANFSDAMSRLRATDAILEVQTPDQLGESVSILLSTPDQARGMARRAQQVVISERGATERHAKIILT